MKNNDVEKSEINGIKQWFLKSVSYEGEPYLMDEEQVRAVMDTSQNTIVVARAGSGKTRTIVAKIVYLIAKCGMKPEEIMVFVFNANAAREINERLAKMVVDGRPIVEGEVKVASTFHAFSRSVVYDVCEGRKRCGKILAGEKEAFMLQIVRWMMREPKWADKIRWFIKGDDEDDDDASRKEVEEVELVRFSKMMALFVNRAQQKFLAGENTLHASVSRRLSEEGVTHRERLFVELGAECYRRYHWYLLDGKMKRRLAKVGLGDYGTDFNLLVSWASKLISGGGKEVMGLLGGKKYVLIDEYQDFSQLFLAVVLAIRKVVPAVKLFVVGDDLQAINRFAGSDVEYFREFENYFPDGARRLMISTNYRCDREIVGRARKFMRKGREDKGEFRAFSRKMGQVVLVDPRLTECKVATVDYDKRVSAVDRIYINMVRRMLRREPKRSVVRYIKAVVEIIEKNKGASEIMLLHRNNETNLAGMSLVDLGRGLKWGLARLGIMTEAEFEERVRIMTMHKSKGLEAEVVIILEADEGVIPKTHPDTILYTVFGETEEVSLSDQKRLFYVAMTRAKKRLYIIHDKASGPGFIGYLGRGVEKMEN